MLATELQEAIRQTYRQIADGLPGFMPRREQNYLVAEIAKTLNGDYDPKRRILVAEAGTGIGKSLAYAQGAIPLARLANKKLIISTATVALQEQLIDKDLPFFLSHTNPKFTFMLAKGRQRYSCAHLLEAMALQSDNENLVLEGFEAFLSHTRPTSEDQELYRRLWQSYCEGKWFGDRDSWPEAISDLAWERIQADRHSCNKKLGHHRDCPFHRARDEMEKVDVLVVNHALLLSDLLMGGGVILPQPDDCFYVLDEAHHLPAITRDHGAAAVRIGAARRWLEKLAPAAGKVVRKVGDEASGDALTKLQMALTYLQPDLKEVESWIKSQEGLLGDEGHYRFPQSELPESLANLALSLQSQSREALKALDKLQSSISEALSRGDLRHKEAEPFLAEMGFFSQRLEDFHTLWQLLTIEPPTGSAPLARWFEQVDGDYELHASPIEVGHLLETHLWSKALGVVLVSATLTALSSFDYFRHQAGLREDDGTQYLRLKSPFDYSQAELYLPKMRFEPNAAHFTQELIEVLPKLVEGEKATLILFSSYRQMNEVVKGLREQGLTLLVQKEAAQASLIQQHKAACDQGESSILVGTSSLAEGLDLPGHYLTNLIITKLPFAVPTSPLEAATAEWITTRGGNAFMQLTVPEASRKLIQACGRLIRQESDRGRVVLLDKRLLTKAYGKRLLDALPPFTRRIE